MTFRDTYQLFALNFNQLNLEPDVKVYIRTQLFCRSPESPQLFFRPGSWN